MLRKRSAPSSTKPLSEEAVLKAGVPRPASTNKALPLPPPSRRIYLPCQFGDLHIFRAHFPALKVLLKHLLSHAYVQTSPCPSSIGQYLPAVGPTGTKGCRRVFWRRRVSLTASPTDLWCSQTQTAAGTWPGTGWQGQDQTLLAEVRTQSTDPNLLEHLWPWAKVPDEAQPR